MEALNEETRCLLALLRLPGAGPGSLNTPLLAGTPPSEILRHPAQFLPERLVQALHQLDWGPIDQDMSWLASPDAHLISLQQAHYPASLRLLPDAPTALFVRGNAEILNHPQIAIVGSRNPTQGGAQNAYDFAAHLAQSGLAITSGLALGIDTAAHQGALSVSGLTIAVMGTGLDRVYPAKNLDLARKVAEHGALVSEFPLGTAPKPGHFPRRNRIISGLALGTLVVEAALESGSLITARLAAEQSREVFAIPGSIHNPLARGCHALIRQGAKLVETAQDILEELAPRLHAVLSAEEKTTSHTNPEASKLDADYANLLDYMGFDPVSVDTLVNRSGFSVEVLSSMLLLLELEGHVSSVPGGLFCRVKHD